MPGSSLPRLLCHRVIERLVVSVESISFIIKISDHTASTPTPQPFSHCRRVGTKRGMGLVGSLSAAAREVCLPNEHVGGVVQFQHFDKDTLKH